MLVSRNVSLPHLPYRTSRMNHGLQPFSAFAHLAYASGKNCYALSPRSCPACSSSF
ncbi:hypothetical protein [uncultured Mucilaginibacter sp.]|uniref:hypothetical protein n=1 Tax=uncultured Mucilaginibacter sp. TaxID=797541 RepID=UPI0025EE001B|nr:hypothetical protein [uncultured Mucilaginibacter sp.]